MLTPDQIRRRALNCYEVFLRSLCTGEPFFPLNVLGGGLAKLKDFVADRAAIELLRSESKAQTGFGYDITWTERKFKRLGVQTIPATVAFTTQDDYARFLGKMTEIRAFQADYSLISQQFPELIPWAQARPLRVVAHAGEWDGLLGVCAHLRQYGRPNCYLRELPVDVDTKFIERKRGVFNELLSIAAPNCVAPDSVTFEARFGFRQKQPLIRFRALDPTLVGPSKLPFNDFAIPLDEACRIGVTAKNILVVENETTFLTLPPLAHTLALLGAGDSVSLFRQMDWLKRFRIVYWGDMDTHGFAALSLLRKHHAQTESLMMDTETYEQFRQFSKKAAPYVSKAELVLSDSEMKLFKTLDAEDRMLEQERILLGYASRKLQEVLN
jgi:hypothetical protein